MTPATQVNSAFPNLTGGLSASEVCNFNDAAVAVRDIYPIPRAQRTPAQAAALHRASTILGSAYDELIQELTEYP